jgi:peptidoglycan/LPS O-acetylase OafA/YrhL
MASATVSRTRSPRSGAKARSTFRRDIQGLRAVAVLVVFLDHMLGWPTGGFAGVDMFFVISGFLITGLLLREYESTGHISFKRFYTGRAKRIFPAATLVLIATVIVGSLVFTAQRATSITWDAVWAFLFGANWNFAVAGTDYFQQGGAVSPLQHYWSLSVEEQFYFVWPWLLLALLYVFARRSNVTTVRVRAVAGCAIGVIAAASFAWALVQSVDAPTVAYFSTFTRAWELGVGALIAVVAPSLGRIPSRVRPILAYLGLALMVISCLILTSETPWPAPGAVLPVLGTALVIISGIGQQASHLWPLTNPVAVYVGDISYSLYLWHFPVIVFGTALFPNAGLPVYLGIAVAGFGLAIATYHAIERPLWKSPLGSRRSRSEWRRWRADHGPQAARGGLLGLAVTAVTLVAVALLPFTTTSAQSAGPQPVRTFSFGTDSATEAPSALVDIRRQVTEAAAQRTWPELTPSIDAVGPASKVSAWVQDGCLALESGAEDDPATTAERCVYGDPAGEKTVMLLGDSVGISWFPALESALAANGWRILVHTMHQCPVSDVTVLRADKSAHPDCDPYRAWTFEQVQAIRPDLIVIGQADNTLDRLASGAKGADARLEVEGGTVAALRALSGAASTIAVLTAPPSAPPILECYSSAGTPAACATPPNDQHRSMNNALAAAVGNIGPGVELINTDALFCSSTCPAFVGNVVVRADRTHLTETYARHLGPAMAELLSGSLQG